MKTPTRDDFEYDCLAVISGIETRGDEPYGLAIKRGLEDNFHREVNHGKLYPRLDSLAKDGLVEKSPLDRRSNAYRLTNEGMGALRDRIGGLQDTMDGKTVEVAEA